MASEIRTHHRSTDRSTEGRRPARRSLTELRAELRERRRARIAYRALEAELASYTNPAEVDDLLAAVSQQEGPDADAIRGILVNKLPHRRGLFAA